MPHPSDMAAKIYSQRSFRLLARRGPAKINRSRQPPRAEFILLLLLLLFCFEPVWVRIGGRLLICVDSMPSRFVATFSYCNFIDSAAATAVDAVACATAKKTTKCHYHRSFVCAAPLTLCQIDKQTDR